MQTKVGDDDDDDDVVVRSRRRRVRMNEGVRGREGGEEEDEE